MMNKLITSFLVCSGAFVSAQAESLLKPVPFPKTFQDLSFTSRIEVLREGYLPFEIEYDENGICISGCAYKGITIKEDMEAVDEATDEMAALIEAEEQTQPTQPTQLAQPTQPTQPTQLAQLAQLAQPTEIATGWCKNGLSTALPLRYPVDMSNFKYPISSDFGFRTSSPNGARFHPAIDIACPKGTPVYATADGVVTTVGHETSPGGAGHYIDIQHKNGLISQYLHLDRILVKKGDTVKACQQIALSGNSGMSKQGSAYAAHLDYRIRFNSDKNKYVDLLCPCKTANRKTNQSSNADLNLTCAHSLFNATYKFRPYNPNSDEIKRSLWRVKHGHCMQNNADLLPDERK